MRRKEAEDLIGRLAKNAYSDGALYIIRVDRITDDLPFKVCGKIEGIDAFPTLIYSDLKRGSYLRDIDEIILHRIGESIEVNNTIEVYDGDEVNYDQTLGYARRSKIDLIKKKMNASEDFIQIDSIKLDVVEAKRAIKLIRQIEPVPKGYRAYCSLCQGLISKTEPCFVTKDNNIQHLRGGCYRI